MYEIYFLYIYTFHDLIFISIHKRQQTCLDLLEMGKEVHVICDGVSSQKPYDREIALQRMSSAGAYLTTAQSLAFSLMQGKCSLSFVSLGFFMVFLWRMCFYIVRCARPKSIFFSQLLITRSSRPLANWLSTICNCQMSSTSVKPVHSQIHIIHLRMPSNSINNPN